MSIVAPERSKNRIRTLFAQFHRGALTQRHGITRDAVL